VEESTLFNRTGGAATLAVGMANIFSKLTHGRWLGLWYHFAIMFEALFILTTIDAGTRVGRYLLQDTLGHWWKPFRDTRNPLANLVASLLVVVGWGYFLVQGVLDPEGGVKALWPLFGIANQLLASIALCLATTVILKMQLRKPTEQPAARASAGNSLRSPALAFVTLLPLIWLLTVTLTAASQKMFDPRPKIGFIAGAKDALSKRSALEKELLRADVSREPAAIASAQKAVRENKILSTNNTVDAVVTGLFMILVILIVLISVRCWILLLARKRLAELSETEPVWLPDYAVAEARPANAAALFALGFALLRELSGEAKVDRIAEQCACPGGHAGDHAREHAYVAAAEQRFTGINRCC
jgi:carbon starvation protein